MLCITASQCAGVVDDVSTRKTALHAVAAAESVTALFEEWLTNVDATCRWAGKSTAIR